MTAHIETDNSDPQPRPQRPSFLTEDVLAMACAAFILGVGFLAVSLNSSVTTDESGSVQVAVSNPLDRWISKPGGWSSSPLKSLISTNEDGTVNYSRLIGTFGSMVALAFVLGCAIAVRDPKEATARVPAFLKGFVCVFLLATISYVLATQEVIKASSLEYPLWALLIALIISNTIGTPNWLKPAVQTEFYIKTGLVILGAEVLMSRMLALGVPGIFVSWVVTPVVLISTYAFGQRVLKMESRSLNMVISADMSVCGVSAAIAAGAACKAKKEELSLAIGISLAFTVVMMFLMPIFVKSLGLSDEVGGAWIGGVVDSTGAVAAAGEALGQRALEVAATVKMIQNILIGACAFGIAAYWVAFVERGETKSKVGLSEIWKRFPRFVLGFITASILFSVIYSSMQGGPEMINSMIKGTTGDLRGWLFCLAFVSIGLETRFSELMPYFKGGKPMILYVCGQTLNLVLTFIMAYLMFGVIFKDFIAQ